MGWQDDPVLEPTAAPAPAFGKDDEIIDDTPTLGAGTTGALHFSRHLAAGLGDKITAAVMALDEKRHDKTGKVTFGDAYNRDLAFLDKTMEASDREHPVARWIGNAGGVIGNAVALGAGEGLNAAGEAAQGAKALTAGQKLLQAMGNGAKVGGALGAASGFGQSRSNSALGTAIDTGAGLIGGAGLGGVMPLGGSLLRALASKGSDVLEQIGAKQARRVLLNGADSLSNREKLTDTDALEALKQGAIKVFGTTKGAYQRLSGLVDQLDTVRTGIIDKLQQAGVQGADAVALADKLVSHGADLERNTMNNALPKEYEQAALDVLGKSDGGKLLLSQAERLKSSLQAMAKYGKFEDTPLNEVKQHLASIFRQANENAVETAAKAPGASPEIQQLAEQFVPVKQQEGRLIAAMNAARRGAVRSSNRSGIGLKDTIMGGAAVASGHPGLAPLALIASKLGGERGASTVARTALLGSKALGSLGNEPGALTKLLPESLFTPMLADQLEGRFSSMLSEMADGSNDQNRATIAALRRKGNQ